MNTLQMIAGHTYTRARVKKKENGVRILFNTRCMPVLWCSSLVNQSLSFFVFILPYNYIFDCIWLLLLSLFYSFNFDVIPTTKKWYKKKVIALISNSVHKNYIELECTWIVAQTPFFHFAQAKKNLLFEILNRFIKRWFSVTVVVVVVAFRSVGAATAAPRTNNKYHTWLDNGRGRLKAITYRIKYTFLFLSHLYINVYNFYSQFLFRVAIAITFWCLCVPQQTVLLLPRSHFSFALCFSFWPNQNEMRNFHIRFNFCSDNLPTL